MSRLKALASALTFISISQFVSAEAYIGEITIVGSTYCPRGTAEANGQLMSIANNTALFSLLSNDYGGDGRTTFALPDLRGREAIHASQSAQQGAIDYFHAVSGGTELIALSKEHLPSHTHSIRTTNKTSDIKPELMPQIGGYLSTPGQHSNDGTSAPSPINIYYENPTSNQIDVLNSQSLSTAGNNLAFAKRSPYLALKYCINLYGRYPSRH